MVEEAGGDGVNASLVQFRALLAEGGMAEVWRGFVHGHAEPVAIKRAKPGATHGQVLRQEAALLASLRHPGVVPVLARGEHEGRPWYAMPLYPRALGESALTFDPAGGEEGEESELTLPIVRQICAILGWLHSNGVVHRDLKPGNVLLDEQGRPVLADFGIAVHLHDAEGREAQPVNTLVGGTRGYASPEQRRGLPLDGRSDLYAVGRMLESLDRPELDALTESLLAPRADARPPYAGPVGEQLEALGGGALPEDWPDGSPRLFRPPLTGRDALLAEADAFLDRSAKGPVHLVLGPSGSGKTRLLREILRRARPRGLRVHSADCGGNRTDRGESARALQGFAPLLRTAVLEGRAEAWEDALPVLRAVVDGLGEGEVAPPNADQLRASALRALADVGSQQAQLLVIDDVQWADELTLAVVEVLLREPMPGLAVLLSARSEELPDSIESWRRQGLLADWVVPTLGQRDITDLAVAMTAGSSMPEDVAEALVQGSAGSPLLATILLDEAEASGDLRWDGARWTWAAHASLRQSPRGIAVLHNRLQRLSDEARRVLGAASVLGKVFRAADLEAILGLDPLPGLAELRASQIAEQLDDVRFAFTHDRLLEAAYDNLAEAEVRALHLGAAEVRADHASAAELGRHLLRGGRSLDAVPHLLTGAEEALQSGQMRLARSLFDELRAVDAGRWFEGLPPLERAEILVRRGLAVHANGQAAVSLEIAREVLPLLGMRLPSSQLGWGLRLASELATQARYRWWGAPVRDGEALRRDRAAAYVLYFLWYGFLRDPAPLSFLTTLFWGVNLCETGQVWGFGARVKCMVALIYGLAGRQAWADAAFERGEAWADREEGAARDGALAATLTQKGFLAIYQARYDEARVHTDRALDHARRSQDAQRVEYALFNDHLLARSMGDMPRARERVQDLFRLRRREGQRHFAGADLLTAAEVCLQDGDLALAGEHIAAAHADLAEDGPVQRASVWGLEAAWALASGDPGRAHRAAEEVRDILGTGTGGDPSTSMLQRVLPLTRVELIDHAEALDVPRDLLVARAQEAVREAERQARTVLMGETSARHAAAQLAVRRGASDAEAKLRAAVDSGRARAMPFELACALEGLGRHVQDAGALAEAHALFVELGAARHARRTETA
ncbi:MAG: hypothetical protein EP330_04940 [Deltaproteobacteria bacterium]|nr:MAG: hypothetical protein EP330_04940 [Deltaproteobacteria bacterium]